MILTCSSSYDILVLTFTSSLKKLGFFFFFAKIKFLKLKNVHLLFFSLTVRWKLVFCDFNLPAA